MAENQRPIVADLGPIVGKECGIKWHELANELTKPGNVPQKLLLKLLEVATKCLAEVFDSRLG